MIAFLSSRWKCYADKEPLSRYPGVCQSWGPVQAYLVQSEFTSPFLIYLLIRLSHSQRGSVCSVPSYPSLHADSVLTLAFPLLVEVKVKANLQEEFQAQVCSVVAAVGLSALGMEQSLQDFDTLKIKALRKVKFTKPHRRAGIWGDPF